MAYTEFRKSYGDFEIVIPAIDFSRLKDFDAAAVADVVFALHEYNQYTWSEYWGQRYVCNHLRQYGFQGELAAYCICQRIDRYNHGLEHYIDDVMGFAIEEADIHFRPQYAAGTVLRTEWCKHMAKEIEREFGL